MIFFYYLILIILFIPLSPFIFILSFCKEKYKQSLKARFFLYKNLIQKKADVHFHACSYGEVNSIKELSLNYDSRISVITQTGFDLAKSFCSKVNFLAFEIFLPFWLSKTKVLVIFEAEFWLMLVFIAKLKEAKILLINARISDNSYSSYKKFSFFYKKIFSYIDEIFVQSDKDKTRFSELGAKNIKVFTNIKSTLKINPSKKYTKFKEKLIIFASTHKGEEELLLQNFKLEKNEKLIIAPRHPERFVEVETLLKDLNLSFDKFSNLNDISEFNKEILLLDKLGELVNFYAISDIVVLCGSFIDNIGGHNPIEVASFDNVLISGKFIHNQKSLFEMVENVCFCENLQDLNDFIHNFKTRAKLKSKLDLSPIMQSIQDGINARKSI
ncbi:3-deoxy-D-manno-octulosonic acid transferase [Campylobacter sp. LR264d]|uniref:lipid IV(A) 3-deoxy-D-manno-octulosonic acid transferase n=1 Tax=Campylobacter sp. LR264d TaxID=2593544 RepID=UPI001239D2C8|nr:lipid IV(A) 3-deoxy-D-manno-octulosonic acid transferase [Campylobacter sp. LR264d]KAA6230040.1 3-deoxy-D-manno-octulosonic acid transferase [Campylobacter sp. LR264d]